MTDYKAIHRELQNQLEQDQGNPYIINQLAIACMEINDYYEAVRIFQLNAEQNPGVESWSNLAYFYFTEGIPGPLEEKWANGEEDAVQLLEQVLLLKPDTEVPSALLGEIYFAGENWDKARQTLELSAGIQPVFENQHNLGSALFRLGQISEAAHYFGRAHEARKEAYRYLSLYNYVRCQMQLGNYPEQEIAELEQALDNPHSEADKESLAEIYYEAGQFSKVVDVYQDSKLWLSPSWVLPYYYALLQCNLTEQAAEVQAKVITHIAEQIRECEQDDDEDYTWADRQMFLQEIESDRLKYQDGFERIGSAGYRPDFTFVPYLESKCYLFGCRRHGNASYSD